MHLMISIFSECSLNVPILRRVQPSHVCIVSIQVDSICCVLEDIVSKCVKHMGKD